MTNLTELQTLIAAVESAIAEYEQSTGFKATDLRKWLREMKHQRREQTWRERQDETVGKMAEISHNLEGGT